MSVQRNIELAGMILNTLKDLFTGEASPKQLMGPIGIAQVSGEAAQRHAVLRVLAHQLVHDPRPLRERQREQALGGNLEQVFRQFRMGEHAIDEGPWCSRSEGGCKPGTHTRGGVTATAVRDAYGDDGKRAGRPSRAVATCIEGVGAGRRE